MTKSIFSLEKFAAYRSHCKQEGYCMPFVPYVGDEYGKTGAIKFVYCGGAAWWSEPDTVIDDDAEAHAYSSDESRKFVLSDMYGSAFWSFFRELAAIVPGLAGEQDETMLKRFVWTNITKTGLVGENAPPNDPNLRPLDVAQVRHELDVLLPDLIVCVSGSLVTSTAYEIFDTPEWKAGESFEARTGSTWIRQAPWGGWLLWTMHPAYKTREWRDSVLADVKAVIERIIVVQTSP